MELSGKARRYLRALAHDLEPVVRIGKAGINEGVLGAVDTALLTHELIKVRLLQEAPVDRHEAGEQIAAELQASLVQVLGRNLIVYRPHPEKPTIVLPVKKGEGVSSVGDESGESDADSEAEMLDEE